MNPTVFYRRPTFFIKATASLTFFGGLPFIFRILSFFFSPKEEGLRLGLCSSLEQCFGLKFALLKLKLTTPLRVSPGHKTRHKDPSVFLRYKYCVDGSMVFIGSGWRTFYYHCQPICIASCYGFQNKFKERCRKRNKGHTNQSSTKQPTNNKQPTKNNSANKPGQSGQDPYEREAISISSSLS